MHPWLNVFLVLSILLGLMLGLRVWQRSHSPNPELVRKLVHIPMGLMTLTFPWLFDSPWTVTVLGGLAIAFLLSLRLVPFLAQQLGSVLGGVKRRSLGEIYFTVSIVSLFWLALGNSGAVHTGDRLLFVIPMLILALADAVAALIGVRYGKTRYTTAEGFKSAEGSLAFFMATFFSVHVPLLLFSSTGRVETLLIAIILGLLVMLLEAIAWRGIDNLFIPIGSFVLLRSHLSLDISGLLTRLLVTILLVILVLVWRRRTTLNDSAILGAAFIGYLAWSLGGIAWLLPPLMLFLTYPFFVPWIASPESPDARRWFLSEWGPKPGTTHTVSIVLSVCAGGLLWLFLFALSDRPSLLYPYTLAFAANLAVVGVAGIMPQHYWSRRNGWAIAGYSLKAWALVTWPMMLFFGFSFTSILGWLIALPAILLTALGFYLWQPWLRQQASDTLSNCGRAAITILGSCLAWIPFLLLIP